MNRFSPGSSIRASRSEKRSYYRVRLNAEVKYQLEDNTETQVGQCQDLSGGGLSFKTDTRIREGQRLNVRINSSDQRFEPLEACLEVLRVQMINNEFLVAGSFASVNN
jgi:c-di-GMP-binding flagellar brake protein YcgR